SSPWSCRTSTGRCARSARRPGWSRRGNESRARLRPLRSHLSATTHGGLSGKHESILIKINLSGDLARGGRGGGTGDGMDRGGGDGAAARDQAGHVVLLCEPGGAPAAHRGGRAGQPVRRRR